MACKGQKEITDPPYRRGIDGGLKIIGGSSKEKLLWQKTGLLSTHIK